jgi:hypothetical protein
MDCAHFEEIIHDLDRPGTQGLAARDAALIHAESCDRCAQLMTESESLDFALQLLGARDMEAEAPARIEAALLQEFRNRKIEASRKRIPWRFAAIGTAASVLLAGGLFLRHEAGPVRESPSPAQTALLPGPGQDIPAGASAAGTEQAENQSSEYATAYVTLPGANDPSTLDGGSIVRVVLSRSALTSLGVPVADSGAGDRIPADLVLSEDGAPQAIRLVSQTDSNQ